MKSKKQKEPVKREFSAGGVVFKKEDGLVFWLLGKHSGYHKWVLPKGKIEKGEKSQQAAVRETEEETGVKAQFVAGKPVHKESYFFYDRYGVGNDGQKVSRKEKTKVYKTVTFYLLKYESGDPKDFGLEMEDAGWFLFDEALEKMAFSGEKEALKKAKKILERPQLL